MSGKVVFALTNIESWSKALSKRKQFYSANNFWQPAKEEKSEGLRTHLERIIINELSSRFKRLDPQVSINGWNTMWRGYLEIIAKLIQQVIKGNLEHEKLQNNKQANLLTLANSQNPFKQKLNILKALPTTKTTKSESVSERILPLLFYMTKIVLKLAIIAEQPGQRTRMIAKAKWYDDTNESVSLEDSNMDSCLNFASLDNERELMCDKLQTLTVINILRKLNFSMLTSRSSFIIERKELNIIDNDRY